MPFTSSDHRHITHNHNPTYNQPTALPPLTTTTVAGCTYVSKANSGCITTDKQTHRLSNTCITDYLSKWTDAAWANQLRLDVFAGFYFVLPTKNFALCSSLSQKNY